MKQVIVAAAAALWLLGAPSCSRGRVATPNQHQVSPDEFFESSNLERFVGRTVAELVSELPQPYEEIGPIDEPPGKLIGFSLRFSGSRRIDVYCLELEHVAQFSEERTWDFETFKKERVSKIEVKKP